MTRAQLWNVLLSATTVIGFALAIWQSIRAEQLNRRQRDLDWPRFRSAASDLARAVDRSDFVPDVILALSERGAMVAYLIARELHHQVPIITAGYLNAPGDVVDLPGFTALRGTKATVYLPERIDELGDRRLLLVDDFVMSGDGMATVVRTLTEAGYPAERIRTAAVVATRLSIVSRKGPDFRAREAHDFDFYFPWGRAQ